MSPPEYTPREHAFGLPCPNCAAINLPDDARFVEYFSTGKSLCIKCSRPFDFWQAALGRFTDWPVSETAFHLLGAKVTVVTARLEAEKTTDLDLAPHIPAGAEVLLAGVSTVGYESGPPTWPTLMLTDHQLVLDPLPLRIRLYGAGMGDAHAVPVHASVMVFWVAPGPDEVPLHQLVDAARQFATDRYIGVIIPANVAVESALNPALTAWVRTYCSKDHAEDFLGPRGATYSHQLKVLINIASRALGIEPLPNQIRVLLESLRQYRNDLGHLGAVNTKKRPIPDREMAASFLTAAVFGYRYARYLRDSIGKVQPDASAPDDEAPTQPPPIAPPGEEAS